MYMNPESGLERCFLLLCFCDLFFFICETQSWTYNLYCHGWGLFFTPANGGCFEFQIVQWIIQAMRGLPREMFFFLPTQLDDMI